MTRRALAALLFAPILPAQTVKLRVYSEFQRVDPFGEILAVDRAQKPREILSPAMARNAFTSFHVAVTAPEKESYFLVVQSNPENVFQWTLQEEKFVKQGNAWIPDTLEEARPPYYGVIPDPQANIPGQTTRVYLLDVWVPKDARVGLARLEVLAKVAYWSLAPMEVRIQGGIAPDLEDAAATSLPPIGERADTAASEALEAYITGKTLTAPKIPLTVRAAIRRNAIQDMGLALRLEEKLGKPDMVKAVRGVPRPRSAGAEWYLNVRDLLNRWSSP